MKILLYSRKTIVAFLLSMALVAHAVGEVTVVDCVPSVKVRSPIFPACQAVDGDACVSRAVWATL